MQRRKFIALGSGVGLTSLFAPQLVRQVAADVNGVVNRAQERVDQRRQTSIQSSKGYISFRHPRFVERVEQNAMYDGTVIVFRTEGSITFPSGRTFHGVRGDKFRLVCFRDIKTRAITKKRLIKVLSQEEFAQRVANKHGKEAK